MDDFKIQDHGSIVILFPISDEARDWVSEFIPEDHQHCEGGVVMGHQYADDVINGALDYGLTVS